MMRNRNRLIPVLLPLAFLLSATLGAQTPAPEFLWEVGAVTGGPHETWGQVFSAAVSDSFVVAYDINVSAVSMFDTEGHYVRSVGRPGQGPGDLGGPVEIYDIRGDTLVTLQSLDGMKSRFLLSTGRHLVTRRMDTDDLRSVRDSRAIGGSRYHLTNPYGGIGGLAARLFRSTDGDAQPDTLLELSDLFLTYRSKREGNIEMTLSTAQTGPEGVARFLGDSSLLILNGIQGTLTTTRLTESGLDTLARVELPEKGGPTTEKDERRLRDYVEQWHQYMHWDELYVPEMTSAWVAMILDGESAVWIKRNVLLDDVPETWIRMRFDHPGVFQEFTFPARVTVKGVHGDRVVAVRKGEYDEEYLQLYRVQPWGE